MGKSTNPKPKQRHKPKPKPPSPPPAKTPAPPHAPTNSKSKFRQESNTAKPSEKLRRDPPPGSSGQVDPKLSNKEKPKSKEEKAAAKESKQFDKSKLRAEKSDSKLDYAREKLANQKPYKPPGVSEKLTRAAGFEVMAQVHRKVHEVEQDNVGVEAAHSVERFGERTGRAAVRHVKHRIRTRPARQVRKMEKKNIKANADYHFRELAIENPELNSNAIKRHMHKKRIQKQFQKQAQEAAKKGAAKATKESASLAGKAGRAVVDFVKRHPKGVLIALLCFLLIVILQSCIGGALTIGNGLVGAIGGTSYLAEDKEIDEAELRYTEWEVDLYLQASNARISHPGNNEYRFNLAAVGHDPFALLAYLTAKYDSFTFAAVQDELQSIFNQQYSLTFTRITERRSYTVRVSTPGGGSTTRTVYYNYYILQTTLTARPFGEVIAPLLTTQDERDRYEIYMFLHGNRQYVGSPFDFEWLPYVSCYYGYRVHPITEIKDYHSGVDIAVTTGTPIRAGGNGVVLESGDNGSYGLNLLVDYGNGTAARYAHCSSLLVSAGQLVNMGDIIALSGNTGASTGPHLHMEVIKDGRYLNPLYFVDGTIIY